MLPYSSSLILDNASNYGIVKTETVFGFGNRSHSFVDVIGNNTDWFLTPVDMQRSLQDSLNSDEKSQKTKKKGKSAKKSRRSKKRKGKAKKCIFKILKKGEGGKKGTTRRKNKNRIGNMKKKLVMPMVIGLLAAKSILIPVALKALAFISAKGFLMGFFSTILASFLSLKGMFDHSHRYQDRKDEKTQVEIIQVPTKEDHHYHDYDDHYYKKNDFFLPYPLSTNRIE